MMEMLKGKNHPPTKTPTGATVTLIPHVNCLCPRWFCFRCTLIIKKNAKIHQSLWCSCLTFTWNSKTYTGCREILLICTMKSLLPITFYSGNDLFSLSASAFYCLCVCLFHSLSIWCEIELYALTVSNEKNGDILKQE